MAIEGLFHHTIEIVRRASVTSDPFPTTYDNWNDLEYGADSVVATVRGRIRPLTVEEQATLADAGSVVTESRGYLPTGTAVAAGDRLRKSTGETYEVRGVTPDPGGTSAYVFVHLNRVVP